MLGIDGAIPIEMHGPLFNSVISKLFVITSHKNYVKYLFCKIHFSGPLFLIVEYCPHGNLRDFLRNNRPSIVELTEAVTAQLTLRDLLSIAYQIARGMSYLSSKKVIS